jgi:hypothetical protein
LDTLVDAFCAKRALLIDFLNRGNSPRTEAGTAEACTQTDSNVADVNNGNLEEAKISTDMSNVASDNIFGPDEAIVECPLCSQSVKNGDINRHIETSCTSFIVSPQRKRTKKRAATEIAHSSLLDYADVIEPVRDDGDSDFKLPASRSSIRTHSSSSSSSSSSDPSRSSAPSFRSRGRPPRGISKPEIPMALSTSAIDNSSSSALRSRGGRLPGAVHPPLPATTVLADSTKIPLLPFFHSRKSVQAQPPLKPKPAIPYDSMKAAQLQKLLKVGTILCPCDSKIITLFKTLFV